jgi:predicted HTH domain antitoxin
MFSPQSCTPPHLNNTINIYRNTWVALAKLISLRVPTELLKELGQLAKDEMKDRSEFTRELLVLGLKEKRLQRSLEFYLNGKATLWKASRLAGVSLWEMMGILRARKVPAQYGLHEMEEDMKALNA